jgi:transcriptional regulator ATRX
VHQIEGVRFIWNNICFNANGLGCILAHEQGLGKTFQVIVVVHTFLCAKLVRLFLFFVRSFLSTI